MEELRKVYQYAEPNLTLIGWLGFLGFPSYYVVWEFMFPQVYESFVFRLVCSILFLGIIFRNKLKPTWRRHMHLYYQVVITTCLPFFFFYMLLMNDWSHIWVMSFMSAIFLHILLVHITWIMFVQTIVGLCLATFFAWVTNDYGLDMAVDWTQLPVFFFTYLFGSLCFYRYQVDYDSKVSLAKSFGAGIAHEMRNPLSSLYTSMDVIQSILPNDKTDNKENYQLTRKEVVRLHELSDDAIKVIQAGNETIDLLLTSIDENRVSRSTFRKHSVKDVIETAIESFSYKSAKDKAAISLDIDSEFEFFGSDNLLKYAMYNLFKNAFSHSGINDFHIHVTLLVEDNKNKIIVKDTGAGIPREDIESIFKDFYTTGKSGHYGLGLPFCKKVMRSFGGDIQCQSNLGHWTQFSMTLPVVNSSVVRDIKNELTKFKSVLLVSEQQSLKDKMVEISRFMGFELTILNVDSTLKKKEHEFEYDLIIVDITSVRLPNNQLDKLESLYSFSEAQFVYMFQGKPVQRHFKAGFLPVWLDSNVWLANPLEMTDNLFFDTSIVSSCLHAKSMAEEMKRTVMIVDDNESLRKFTAILLEKQGFEVVQKEDGQQAIDALQTADIDLILMDIEMPIMDGIEASRRIRHSKNQFANIPIIAYTGDDSSEMLQKIDASSMSGYIVKPAGKGQLLDKIADWI